MATFKIDGNEIQGVLEAKVSIVHELGAAANSAPTCDWDLTLRLQFDDILPKLGLAPMGAERFKDCTLIIRHENSKVAHTYNLIKPYLRVYEEVEGPSHQTYPGEQGRYVHLIMRGQMKSAANYTGVEVMTVAKGVAQD